MKHPRDEMVLAVLCICVVTVVSGPLVQAVDLTPDVEREYVGLEAYSKGGSLTASNITIAEEGYQLKKGVAGSGIYTTSFPEARLHIDSIDGSVFLVYAVDIPALGYTIQTSHGVDGDSPQDVVIEPPQSQTQAKDVTQDQYRAIASVSVRSGETKRELASQNVTVEVNS
ncbi:hypothetical protein [Haloferax sp. DFSO52]|uniref:hypothetical protein n=1 Tax=Haloferax sp. DFSO52 TaxID=3388505 RepID=UPI003A8623AF